MNNDRTETIGNSLVQHGYSNDRIYLMKLARNDCPHIIAHLSDLAKKRGYSKIFAKIPAFAKEDFKQDGYQVEASIPQFYRASETAYFMARYFDPKRKDDPRKELISDVLQTARLKAGTTPTTVLPPGLSCRLTTAQDCKQMAALYRQVFKSYPFPINDPAYLHETMTENVVYAGIWKDDQLLALASGETDRAGGNVEMTDFATLPEWRGKGLANYLMARLEQEMTRCGITTCYTIARATSYGMNICFARNGYKNSGTLVKNTQISGGLESMNVWYKHLEFQ